MHLSRCYYAIWDKDAETVNLLFNIFIRLCCCARSYRAEGKSQQNCLEYHLSRSCHCDRTYKTKHKNDIGCNLNTKRLFIKNEQRYLCDYVVSLTSVISDSIFFRLGFLKNLIVMDERVRALNDTQMGQSINSDFIFSQIIFVNLFGLSNIKIDPFLLW